MEEELLMIIWFLILNGLLRR